jgi:hypothetical protein
VSIIKPSKKHKYDTKQYKYTKNEKINGQIKTICSSRKKISINEVLRKKNLNPEKHRQVD